MTIVDAATKWKIEEYFSYIVVEAILYFSKV